MSFNKAPSRVQHSRVLLLGEFCRKSGQEPDLHRLNAALHEDGSTVGELKVRVMILILHQTVVRRFGDVDLARLTGGLRSAGQVDRVAKQTVARHSLADHSGDHLARVQADGQFLMQEKKRERRERDKGEDEQESE